MTLQTQFVPSEPSLRDLLELQKKDILLSLCAHHIGVIDSFDAGNQTASVKIAYKKSFTRQNPITGVPEEVLLDYPLLVDCPVIVLGGAASALTFPISAGDECLVLLNDRAIDTWFQGTQNAAVPSPRLHSLSDGIVLVGLRSLPNTLDEYDSTRAVLRNGDTKVGVSATKVLVANDLYTLNGLLQDLISGINDLVDATSAITVLCAAPASPSGPPINLADIVAAGVAISATAMEIGELLE